MATATADPVRLTEAFRAAEAQRAAAVAALVALWFRQRVRPDDQASIERWLAAMVPIILRERSASESRAILFGNTVRTLEVGLGDGFRFEPVKVADLEARVRTSLVVTGLTGRTGVNGKLAKLSGRDLTPAEERALVDQFMTDSAGATGGAAVRHVLNGGREALRDGAMRDKLALGFVRVTKAKPCYFCALLASRGAVYKEDSFDESNTLFDGPGQVKVHDSCGCSVKPIYRREDFFAGRAKQWDQLYKDSTSGTSGKGAILAFRKAYEGRA